MARPLEGGSVAEPGLRPLDIDHPRDGLLYIPRNYDPERPAPLVVMLHGAGGNAHHGIAPLLPIADSAGVILLAPESRRQTWDVLYGEYGDDVSYIDGALEQTFRRFAIDPRHLAAEGFSDGASYALSLAITNGDLFTHIIAFSPGFMAPAAVRGTPRCFISHGVTDGVLPIDRCSRRIVPQIEAAGFDVDYREFDGPHVVPADIAHDALTWFVGKPA